MRTALQNPARNPDSGLAGSVALVLAATVRVLGDAAILDGLGRMRRRIEVARPLPGIADHVVKAVAVGREGGHGRGALITVEMRVLERKGALPGVGHLASARRGLVAPGELRLVQSAASSELPF